MARFLVIFGLLSVCLLTSLSSAFAVEVQRAGGNLQIVAPPLRIECDLKTGRADYRWSANVAIRGAACSARLKDGSELSSADYTIHESAPGDVVPIDGPLGKGIQVTVHHRRPGRPELRQRFFVYDTKPFCSVDVQVVSPVPISSNYVAPIVCDGTKFAGGGARLGVGEKPRTLFAPFDNDMFVRYNSEYSSASYEVTAIYDNTSRHGFVLGSLTHDLWKTGIAMADHAPRSLGKLAVYGGASDQWTRDSQPHGYVSATTITSPRIFVGYFADWRQGMETYGAANVALKPALRWTGGVPFGWNSWAAYKEKVSYERFLAASDFFKAELQPRGFDNPGAVYINVDSFYDNMTPEQLTEAARHIHANGQKAGIYWTPFTYWGDDMNRKVEGTDGLYTYENILLKDAYGKPLPKLDGGHPLDISHPGALARIDHQMKQFVAWGYDFVKIDFLNCGSLEGAHYDPRITTGIAAYNLGMQRIVLDLDPKTIGRPFFISLSIAPLFPHGYAHSRRISCDTFGSLSDTEYMLNSLTYGWWINETLYRFNDPDHIVLSASEAEARSRYLSSVIAGTMLLDSDDLGDASMQKRALGVMTNKDTNAVAVPGRTFRPLEGDTAANATRVFTRRDGNDLLVAVFNYDGKKPLLETLDLARLGLDTTSTYQARELWSGQTTTFQGRWQVALEPAESKIWRVASKP